MGSSWGSALAVHMAQAQPDLFSGYVGSAQFVDYDEGLTTSYDQTLNLAREAADQDSLIKLEEIGPPPWTNPRAFGILRRVTRKYEAISTDAPPLTWYSQPAVGYDTPEYETAYSEGEDYSFLEFVGPNGDGMGPGIDLRQLGASFQMPVILLQGDDDLVTPGVMSRAYFDSLTAPKKTYIRLARTGHDLNQAMIGAQLEALKGLQAEAAVDK
jgi:pimeloyl-ACP methyl ester carboxylesterase